MTEDESQGNTRPGSNNPNHTTEDDVFENICVYLIACYYLLF